MFTQLKRERLTLTLTLDSPREHKLAGFTHGLNTPTLKAKHKCGETGFTHIHTHTSKHYRDKMRAAQEQSRLMGQWISRPRCHSHTAAGALGLSSGHRRWV